MKNYWILLILIIASSCNGGKTHEVQNSKLRALILDGQNNHYIWPKTTMMMKNYLEQTGLFEVDINRTDTLWLGIKYNQDRAMPLGGYIKEFPSDSTARVISADHVKTSNFSIDFSKYDLIVSNLGALTPNWPDKT
ncbi:MAG: hypothetical protein ACJAUR_001439, partial [Ulvibacter sp.]